MKSKEKYEMIFWSQGHFNGRVLFYFVSISAVKINRYGESGHPCLTPLEGLNQSVAKPLFKAALSMSM